MFFERDGNDSHPGEDLHTGIAASAPWNMGFLFPDPKEPGKVAEAVKEMGLRYVVITSVTRDDLARWRGLSLCRGDP